MNISARQRDIIDILRRDSFISIDKLAAHIDVAPHGLRGNVKMFGQFVNRGKAVAAQNVDDVALSCRNIHLIVQFVALNMKRSYAASLSLRFQKHDIHMNIQAVIRAAENLGFVEMIK